MTNSSFLGGERSVRGEGDPAEELGSLIVDTDNDSDASGTGERASATGRDGPDGADILPDRLIGPTGEVDRSTDGSLADAELDELVAEITNPPVVPDEAA